MFSNQRMPESKTETTPNVLIINADKECRVLFESFFDHVDLEPSYVTAVDDVLKVLENKEISLVLLDIHTKEGDGIDVLKIVIKSVKAKSNAPIVVITKSPKKEHISKFVELGASGILTKPIDKQAYVERLKRLITIKPRKKSAAKNDQKNGDEEQTESKDEGKTLITDLIEKLKNDKFDFSAMPQLGYKIIEMLKDDSTPLNKVNAHIEKDPGIYARILKAANSPVFAGSRPIYTPKDAILRIGVKRTIITDEITITCINEQLIISCL